MTSGIQGAMEADYVVVGAGAVGLAFVDVLLDETAADIILVDRRMEPGGHWRDAYPFVQLHNVSALYGVNSTPLGSDALVTEGLDAGCMERARLPEILAYYDRLLREKFLVSGRVRWLAGHDYRSEGEAVCLDDGSVVSLQARRRVVDATVSETRIPKLAGPGFPVAPGVRCVGPDAISVLAPEASSFSVIGAGKTAMDTVFHLLSQGVDPDDIIWVRPRDPWLLNRMRWQPTEACFTETVGGFADEMEAAAKAASVSDFFLRLEAAGVVMRLDPDCEPTMFRCAIAGPQEVDLLRQVHKVVRLGHVTSIERDRIVLEKGRVSLAEDCLQIHCTADGVPRRTPVPVFQPGKIVLQYVRRCAPLFSAALIARIEALSLSDDVSNGLSTVAPMVDEPSHWVQAHLIEAKNRKRWSAWPALSGWLSTSRLDGFGAMIARVKSSPNRAEAEILTRYARAVAPALANMKSWASADRHLI